MEYRTLKDINPGISVVVVKIVCSDKDIKRRIMDVGILPGVFIQVIKVAPFGDPIQISLLGFDLIIRKSDASKIIVKNIEENDYEYTK